MTQILLEQLGDNDLYRIAKELRDMEQEGLLNENF